MIHSTFLMAMASTMASLLRTTAGHDTIVNIAVARDADCEDRDPGHTLALSALQLKSLYSNVNSSVRHQLQTETALDLLQANEQARQDARLVGEQNLSISSSMLAGKWSSCREIGCFTAAYYPGLCMCNMWCYTYSNCCPDFFEVCQSPALPPISSAPATPALNNGGNASASNVSVFASPSQDSLAGADAVQTLYVPKVPSLAKPSDAPVHTFYMYRVEGDKTSYPWENVNTGNLAGIMWYLHNEVVERTPRKFGATRILRYKVSTKATAPLFEKGMNFGLRFAFDFGMCTGPFNCAEQFAYGYFVGCNYVDQWPTDEWKGQNHYPGATWFSLPGPCSGKRFGERLPSCRFSDPGGHCAFPTGEGTCTFSYEPAGEISIDELVGIPDYKAFQAKGGREYRRTTDRGRFTNFWDSKSDPVACARRLEAARQLFALRTGGDDLPAPACDFNSNAFFR